MARMVEAGTGPDAAILSSTRSRNPIHAQDHGFIPGRQDRVLADMLWIGFAPDLAPTWHHTFRFPARQMRGYGWSRRPASTGPMSVTRFGSSQAKRTAARGGVRVRANPNPWDVQMAFDNSPATRWRSWRKIEPGMFIETDFGRPETSTRCAWSVRGTNTRSA
jgi:hypothetical protein